MKTRNGMSLRIYAIDGRLPHTIHGAVYIDGGWVSFEWLRSGHVNEDLAPHELDFEGLANSEQNGCHLAVGVN